MLTHYHTPQLGLIPVRHIILLLILLLGPFGLLPIPRILIQIPLFRLPLYVQIMTEFTLLPLLARPLLIKLTQHGLRIHPERHLLHLHRLEQVRRLLLRQFRGLLLLPFLLLLGFFTFLIGGLVGRGLRFDLLDLFLRGAALFVFHAERLVHRGLFRLVFFFFLGRHRGGGGGVFDIRIGSVWGRSGKRM